MRRHCRSLRASPRSDAASRSSLTAEEKRETRGREEERGWVRAAGGNATRSPAVFVSTFTHFPPPHPARAFAHELDPRGRRLGPDDVQNVPKRGPKREALSRELHGISSQLSAKFGVAAGKRRKTHNKEKKPHRIDLFTGCESEEISPGGFLLCALENLPYDPKQRGRGGGHAVEVLHHVLRQSALLQGEAVALRVDLFVCCVDVRIVSGEAM